MPRRKTGSVFFGDEIEAGDKSEINLDKGVCFGCPNELKGKIGKNSCLKYCLKLKQFQEGLVSEMVPLTIKAPGSHIPTHGGSRRSTKRANGYDYGN